jgi:hypothetical protein
VEKRLSPYDQPYKKISAINLSVIHPHRQAIQARTFHKMGISEDTLRTSDQPPKIAHRAFCMADSGHNFSQKSIHTMNGAIKSAKTIYSLANMIGHDVVFKIRQHQLQNNAVHNLLMIVLNIWKTHQTTYYAHMVETCISLAFEGRQEKKLDPDKPHQAGWNWADWSLGAFIGFWTPPEPAGTPAIRIKLEGR